MQMFVAKYCDMLEVEISCDGCNVTLPGCRYRCLVCQDVDLCATCYAGGVNPGGEHSDSHDIVYMMYKCNECQGFIVGTRVHCTVCDDFDLCLGCYKHELFPTEHSASHAVTVLPQIKLRGQTVDSSLPSYTHQQVWLLFSALSLAVTGMVHRHTVTPVDPEYLSRARALHNHCVRLTCDCLKHCQELDSDDTSNTDATKLEHAFAVHAQERLMGLLGAMVDPESDDVTADVGKDDTAKRSVTPTADENKEDDMGLQSGAFLQLLFTIAKGDSGHDVNTQHLAMALIGQLLSRTSAVCEQADRAVRSVSADTAGLLQPGSLTAEYLFNFGADCLQRSGLDWANSMAAILLKLFNSNQWHEVLLAHVTQCVQNLVEKSDLSSIFALFVLAGFPQVLTVGSRVAYTESKTEARHGVVLKHFPDRSKCLLIDLKSRRRRRMIKDENVTIVTQDIVAFDSQHITLFTDIVMRNGHVVLEKGAGEQSVEGRWLLSLSLKALLKLLDGAAENHLTLPAQLYETDLVRCIVQLAAMGTGFSKQWLLKDLEILSLKLYTRDLGSDESADGQPTEEGGRSSEKASLEKTEAKPVPSADPVSSEAITAALSGLTDTEQHCLMTIFSEFKIPLDVLRAMFEMNGRSTNALLMSVRENLERNGNNKIDVDRIAQVAKEGPHKDDEDKLDSIDKGMGRYVKCSRKRRGPVEAVAEPCSLAQRLVATPEAERRSEARQRSRTESAALLKKELELQGRTGARTFMLKVNMAMCVLHARMLLVRLLGQWPLTDHSVSAQLLGCTDDSQVPFLLDLLNRGDMKESFQTVVENVISHMAPASLGPIAATAILFMGDEALPVIVKESEHNYKDNTKFEDSVTLPGATALRVTFDPRCHTEEDCDQLSFSDNCEFTDKKSFSGSSDNFQTFEIQGDTLYYSFVSDSSTNYWGYKFTVSGAMMGRFETGYLIIRGLLAASTNRFVTDGKFWRSIVRVACLHTGSQRLKAIHLLIRVLQRNRPVDLAALKPLWQLFISMSSEDGEASPTVRALTELFYVVEEFAEQWNQLNEYRMVTYDRQLLKSAVLEAVRNVTALSLTLGLKNKLTEELNLSTTSLLPGTSLLSKCDSDLEDDASDME